MKILSSIASALELRDCRGGQVLSLLHEKAVSMVGDAAGQALCYTLARSASTPYFTILENWIYKVVHKKVICGKILSILIFVCIMLWF